MKIKYIDPGKLYTPVFFKFTSKHIPTEYNSCVVNRLTGKVLAKHQEIADSVTEEILYTLKYRYIDESHDLVQIIFEGDKWYINLSFRYATYSITKNAVLMDDIDKVHQETVAKVLDLFNCKILTECHPGMLAISKEVVTEERRAALREQGIMVLSIDFYLRVLSKTSLGIYFI